MRRSGAVVLEAALERYGSGEGGDEDRDAAVTREACGALRSVTLGDDRRKDFSGAVYFTCPLSYNPNLVSYRKAAGLGGRPSKRACPNLSILPSGFWFGHSVCLVVVFPACWVVCLAFQLSACSIVWRVGWPSRADIIITAGL